ncbi:MAG: hypothetical protein PVH50_07690 [Anaerolineae bacterium]
MDVITATLGPWGLAAVAYLSLTFSTLSRRLNSVAKKKDHQRWFYAADALIALAAMSQLLRSAAALAPQRALPIMLEPWFAFLTFHVPLAVGTTVDLALAWYYWGWILKAKPR